MRRPVKRISTLSPDVLSPVVRSGPGPTCRKISALRPCPGPLISISENCCAALPIIVLLQRKSDNGYCKTQLRKRPFAAWDRFFLGSIPYENTIHQFRLALRSWRVDATKGRFHLGRRRNKWFTAKQNSGRLHSTNRTKQRPARTCSTVQLKR